MNLRSLVLPFLTVGVLLCILYSEILSRPKPVIDGRVHITYWEKWTGFESDAMKAVVDEYNRTQNRVFVEYLTISNIERKTLMAIAAKHPPDVAGLYGPNVAQYADSGAVMRLDDYCRKNGISAAQYIPAFWDAGVIEGHIYSLPTTPATTALHYNTDMLKDAGFDPKKPPQTMEEMQAMASKLTTHKNGHIDKAAFMPGEPDWWSWSWGYLFGGSLWNGKDKITANSPENVRAYRWVQWWSKTFGATELQTFKSGFGNFSSPQNAFLSSEVAMEMQGVWMYNFIDKYSPKLQWAVAPFPHPADRPDLANTTLLDEDVLTIPQGATHPDEAFDFVKFVQSQKGMELLCLGQRKASPLIETSPEFYRKHPNPFIKMFADLAKGKNTVFPPKTGIWSEYSQEMKTAFEDIVVNGKDPQAALDYVQARMQPVLDDYLAQKRRREETKSGASATASVEFSPVLAPLLRRDEATAPRTAPHASPTRPHFAQGGQSL